MISPKFHDFLDVFCKHSLGTLPTRKKWDHKIELKERFKTKKAWVISMTLKEKKEILAFIKKNLAKGFIQPSHSLQMLAVFLIPKNDSGKQVITDYRHLNSGMISSNYPLLLISQLTDQLQRSDMFSKMDIQ